ncbi:uncharacterized protein LOC111369408 isoform X1 [Olea europaea var. sylvestris]|uniref:uncharacterized protein LOC111369408 isoform X1 n=1 Tax=Olea europaea var. sylvestris TaxID=158386 RepID=UPI000C1CE360|nr:uncharacterized protein LOC111369408 isoform X1 [Olea europaea var. sylvestris]
MLSHGATDSMMYTIQLNKIHIANVNHQFFSWPDEPKVSVHLLLFFIFIYLFFLEVENSFSVNVVDKGFLCFFFLGVENSFSLNAADTKDSPLSFIEPKKALPNISPPEPKDLLRRTRSWPL